MTTCYIGIGSNLGDRRSNIDKAIEAMRSCSGINVVRISTIYETEPVSDVPQGKFLNGVIEIDTELSPRKLLKGLNRIEDDLGRVRSVKNGPRVIDLDILYYGDRAVSDTDLVIPHPRIGDREFVLRGLRELGKS